MARAISAPSVGCPITAFFRMTALLATQPAWKGGISECLSLMFEAGTPWSPAEDLTHFRGGG